LLPEVCVELPVPLADGAPEEADGLVLALPLAEVPVPGALSLIAPPLGEVLLAVLLPAGEVVVVVVVVWLALPELLLVALDPDAPLCQSPCSFTALPTCAERSWLLCTFAILPFFSCSMKLPPCWTTQPFRVLPLVFALLSVLLAWEDVWLEV